jgi:hypothetical protein
VERVRELAAAHGLDGTADHALPANNRLLCFVRTRGGPTVAAEPAPRASQ